MKEKGEENEKKCESRKKERKREDTEKKIGKIRK